MLFLFWSLLVNFLFSNIFFYTTFRKGLGSDTYLNNLAMVSNDWK